jgi:hypothetical protein
MIVAAGFAFDETTAFPGSVALLPVVGTALVLWASVEQGLAARLAALPPVRMIGDVSYALYLWHWPLIQLAPYLLGEYRRWHAPALALASILLAWLTTRFFEEPIRARPIRARTGRAVLVGSFAAAALVLATAEFGARQVRIDAAALAELARAASDSDPLCFGAAAMARNCPPATRLVPPLDLLAADTVNRRDCWSDNGESEFRFCSLGPEAGVERRLLAVGDSHNNALMAAYAWIAKTANWRIDVAGKGGCYLTTAPIRQYLEPLREECASWLRQLSFHLASRGRYDALIVTHWEAFPILLEDDQTQFEAEVEGLVEAWREVTERGVPVLAIKDVPRFPSDSLDCLREHENEAWRRCSIPRALGVRAADSQVEAARRVPGAHLIDLDDLYCSRRSCFPVIGGVVVYQDGHHLTATFARTLAPFLLTEMRAVLD